MRNVCYFCVCLTNCCESALKRVKVKKLVSVLGENTFFMNISLAQNAFPNEPYQNSVRSFSIHLRFFFRIFDKQFPRCSGFNFNPNKAVLYIDTIVIKTYCISRKKTNNKDALSHATMVYNIGSLHESRCRDIQLTSHSVNALRSRSFRSLNAKFAECSAL